MSVLSLHCQQQKAIKYYDGFKKTENDMRKKTLPCARAHGLYLLMISLG